MNNIRLETLMNCEVKITNLWMKANTLKINAAKSSALVITIGGHKSVNR